MQETKNLKSFDMESLEEIRDVRRKMMRGGGDNWKFWDEIEAILTRKGYTPKPWKRMENDNIVLGNVWNYDIGEFFYKHKVHRFNYLYTTSDGIVIAEHGPHEELVHAGKHIKKIEEWYVYPDGRMELCKKGCKHSLINNFGYPIYVVSIKITSIG